LLVVELGVEVSARVGAERLEAVETRKIGSPDGGAKAMLSSPADKDRLQRADEGRRAGGIT
jgi:hypothetical protein